MDYILSFTPCFLSESAFDFAVLSIELGDNIGSVLPCNNFQKKTEFFLSKVKILLEFSAIKVDFLNFGNFSNAMTGEKKAIIAIKTRGKLKDYFSNIS